MGQYTYMYRNVAFLYKNCYLYGLEELLQCGTAVSLSFYYTTNVEAKNLTASYLKKVIPSFCVIFWPFHYVSNVYLLEVFCEELIRQRSFQYYYIKNNIN